MNLDLAVAARAAAAHDRRIGGLASLSRAASLGALAGGADGMPASFGSTLATAVRMVDRVHRRAAHMRSPAEPAVSSRLAKIDVHVVGVADHADRRPAGR